MKRGMAVIFAAVLCLLVGCAPEEKTAQRDLFSMDTVMSLQVWGEDAQPAMDAMETEIRRLDEAWSVGNDKSAVSTLNRGEALTDSEQLELIARVQALSVRTGGAFDPQLFALTSLWGFPTKEYRVPTDAEITAAMEEHAWDLGAAVKGYAAQRAADVLKDYSVTHAVLSLGGNVQTYGTKPDGSAWQIAIRDPAGEGYAAVAAVEGTASVVTSGSYQRFFEEDGITYHHILDPKTGRPADSGLLSVTVICRDGLTADALSTALFVMGLERGADFWRESDDFEAVFILTSGEIFATEGVSLSGCSFEVIRREK